MSLERWTAKSQSRSSVTLIDAVAMSSGTTAPPRGSPPAQTNDAGPTDSPSSPGRPSSTPEPPASQTTPPPPPPDTTSSTPNPPQNTSTSETPDPPPSSTSTPPPPPDTTTQPPPSSTESPPSSTAEPPSSTSSPSQSSSSTPPEQTTTTPDSTTPPPSSTTPPPSSTSEETTVSVTGSDAVTSLVVVTHTRTPTDSLPSGTASTSTSTATPNGVAGKDNNGGLDSKAKVAIGVVVPIVAIAILAVIGLFLWKKRRARRAAEAERRKEVEDYAYNPNADPTIPTVGMTGGDSYEMREEGPAGYRGWGSTTLGGSTGRKASTTISGATNGYSDIGPSRGNMSESALLDNPEGEILGAMGPSAANNRGDVRRGASNASSSYSATGRSDGSDVGAGMAYSSNGGGYYDSYGQNPYDAGFGGAGEMPGPPIIRDNPARRSTRVESPGHFPQQSAGISQNF
ncbi:hypothetical protein TgHK011_003651 [Trichoderma gracile]|nr:hypothetical protein TgHK011_003651 [Trichoderma gracile]